MRHYELEWKACAHPLCNEEFELTRSNKKYCSNSCRSAHHQLAKRRTGKVSLETKSEYVIIPETPSNTLGVSENQSETMSLAGVGNAAVGGLIANGIASIGKKISGKSDEVKAIEAGVERIIHEISQTSIHQMKVLQGKAPVKKGVEGAEFL